MTAAAQRPVSSGGRIVRVTLISTLPPHKGVADYTAHLVGGLAQDPSVSLEVIDFASLYPRWLYPGGELRDPTAERPRLPNVRIRTMLGWYNPLSWLFAGLTLKGEVVHAQWWSYILAPMYLVALTLARLRRRCVVITVHNVEPHESGRWRRLLNGLVLRLADGYIVHDARSRDRLAEMVPAGKPIAVIYHGILSSSGAELSAADARRALRVPGGAKVVLCFGNIRPYKGVDVLLRAFARVRERVPGARLIIAGEPWEDWARYDALIAGLGLRDAVDAHLGFVPASDVGAFFAAADVVVLPYLRFDAQSGVGTRALYHGKALVVTDVGGLPELVGDERAVVPPGDADRLAAALTAALTDGALRARLEDDSKARARDLRWDVIAEQTAAFYRSFAREPARRAAAVSPVDERSQEEHV
jgi:glycosyltransferase involved in cell wall biosynthesis